MFFAVRLEPMLLVVSLLWTIGLNRSFFVAALRDQPFSRPRPGSSRSRCC
jgi:hypothetical protein